MDCIIVGGYYIDSFHMIDAKTKDVLWKSKVLGSSYTGLTKYHPVENLLYLASGEEIILFRPEDH